jgi:hypothetical protein
MNKTTQAFVINRATYLQGLIQKRYTSHEIKVTYRTGSPFTKHKYVIQIGRGTQYEITGDTKRELVDNSISFMQGFWCGIDSEGE